MYVKTFCQFRKGGISLHRRNGHFSFKGRGVIPFRSSHRYLLLNIGNSRRLLKQIYHLAACPNSWGHFCQSPKCSKVREAIESLGFKRWPKLYTDSPVLLNVTEITYSLSTYHIDFYDKILRSIVQEGGKHAAKRF